MKIFDLHSDIGMHVHYRHKEKGDKDVLKNIHLPKLQAGEVDFVGIASFFDGTQDWDAMCAMVNDVHDEIASLGDSVAWVTKASDFDMTKTNLIMTVEGMCGISEDVEDKIQWLYDKSVRIGSLCWSESNALATGIGGDPLRGLTDLGARVIRKMNEVGMIIDISHTMEKTFWDILSISDKPVIATHSNCRDLCTHARLLTNQQISAIAQKGGIIGIVAANAFVNDNPKYQDVYHLALHAKHIADLVGIEHVSIGFDYMDFLDFMPTADATSPMAKGLEGVEKSQNLIFALRVVGFSETEVEKIAYQNALRFVSKQLS
ncbi:MAG: membrane dipeptidase [Erysipelotrichaceae bacterium]|jgi:membrane dipeptidase|nr:membrane dipeptidase [Erysipelotrichaceae bacterium]